jgi:YfiR/HmsC-like
MRAIRLAVLISIGILVAQASVCLAQAPLTEGQVKAAFLYNFAQFIQWPNQAFPDRDTPFTMCPTGDPFEGILEKTIEGETLNGRRIVVRRLTPSDNLRGCHLIYIGRLESRRSAEVIKAADQIFAADGVPILTVGDSEDFINRGGMIRFIEAGDRVRFEINPDAAERVSLRVSSRLLRLADIVRPR